METFLENVPLAKEKILDMKEDNMTLAIFEYSRAFRQQPVNGLLLESTFLERQR